MRVWTTAILAVSVLVSASCDAPASPAAVIVEGAWIAGPPGGDVASGFATFRNTGAQADRLVGAATRRASMTMLHDMTVANGVVSMRAAPAGFEIAAGGETVLSPQGAHIMLMGIHPPLRSGESIEIELTFEKAGRMSVPFRVGKSGPTPEHAAHP